MRLAAMLRGSYAEVIKVAARMLATNVGQEDDVRIADGSSSAV